MIIGPPTRNKSWQEFFATISHLQSVMDKLINGIFKSWQRIKKYNRDLRRPTQFKKYTLHVLIKDSIPSKHGTVTVKELQLSTGKHK